jgi:hypothetical protein
VAIEPSPWPRRKRRNSGHARKEQDHCHFTSPRRRKRISSWQVFGLAGCLLAPASQPKLGQCFSWSVRSCSPLRGSPGLSPDSLFSLICDQAPWSETTISGVKSGINPYILSILCKSGPGSRCHCFNFFWNYEHRQTTPGGKVASIHLPKRMSFLVRRNLQLQ